MNIEDVDKIHIRVHGNFQGCLCHPVKALAIYTPPLGSTVPPGAYHYKHWGGAVMIKHPIRRTAKINEATCSACLVLWDTWLESFSANPPRPHRDQIIDLVRKTK